MSAERHALMFPSLAVLVLLAAWMAVRSFREAPPAEPVATVERPRYELDGASWTRYDGDGKAVFTAHSAGIDYFDDASMELSGVQLDTLGDVRGHWQLTAPRGTVPTGEKRLLLGPDVEINGLVAQQPPVVIHTSTLWADWQQRSLTTDAPVHADSPPRSVDAVGMDADWYAQRVTFLHDVKVRRAQTQ